MSDVPALATPTGASLAAVIGTSMAKQVRRARARAARDGVPTAYEVTAEPLRIRVLLPAVEAVHLARDHDQRGHSDLDAFAERRSWRQCATLHSVAGSARLHLLWADGTLAAYTLAVAEPPALRVLDSRCSPAWLRYSPGRVLEAWVVERAIAEPEVDLVDWGSPENPEALLAADHVVTRI